MFNNYNKIIIYPKKLLKGDNINCQREWLKLLSQMKNIWICKLATALSMAKSWANGN